MILRITVVLFSIILVQEGNLRIFKTKHFAKWANKSGIDDRALIKSTYEIENDLIDGKLGNNLVKKRLPVGSQGKRSGARVILAYKASEKMFFIFGFEKNEKDSINIKEYRALRIVGDSLLKLSSKQIIDLQNLGEIIEIGGK